MVFDSRGGEKYIYISLMEGGEYVLPKEIVYAKNDGRFAAKYLVMQEAAINLTGDMNLTQAMAQLEKRYSIDDDVLRQKFIEYDLRIKYIDESARSIYIELDNDMKIVIRETEEIPIDRTFKATEDTDLMIIKYGQDYYFALSNMQTSGNKKASFITTSLMGKTLAQMLFIF